MVARKKIAKCGKRSDKNPSRPKYWASGRLALRKVRALVRSGYTINGAIHCWLAARNRHTGVVPTQTAFERFCRASVQRKEHLDAKH